MKRTSLILVLTALALLALDVLVAASLTWAERSGRMGSMVSYFEYGRSVPGKLARWQETPGTQGNLFKTAWLSQKLPESQALFEAETDTTPIIRSYGMSFVRRIMKEALQQDPTLRWDSHAGPGASPNYTYTFFHEDRANRRPGDIVVLGLLSSSVPGMAALSNQTWNFDQPAPFTYPVYWPEGDGLRAVTPVIQSVEEVGDPARADAWQAQLAKEDGFYSRKTFGATMLDRSPFLRLVRRSLASAHIQTAERRILTEGAYPYDEVLRRMVRIFARVAREDGQFPVVMIIQGRGAGDADILAQVQDTLKADAIPYLATAEHIDPRNPAVFVADGHFTAEVDKELAQAFRGLLPE